MKNKLIYFSLLLLTASFTYFQMDETDLVHWNKKTKLVWEDFKGTAKPTDSLPVHSHILLDFQYQIKTDSLHMTLRNILVRKRSWYKPAEKSKELLNSEQGFFDIAEINTRKMRRTLYTYPIPYGSANATVSSLYRTTIKDRNYEQKKYREETKYGKNKVKQAEWDAKLKKELIELDKFNQEYVNIKLLKK
jgi:hypothetical protein